VRSRPADRGTIVPATARAAIPPTIAGPTLGVKAEEGRLTVLARNPDRAGQGVPGLHLLLEAEQEEGSRECPEATRKVVGPPRAAGNHRVMAGDATGEVWVCELPLGLGLRVGLVPSGVIQPPLHHFQASQACLHSPIDSILLSKI
jgi:hypothetical protein